MIVAVAMGAANPLGFIVGPIIGAAVFANWVHDIYRAVYVGISLLNLPF